MLDVGPGSNDRTKDHETEREKSEAGHGATKPQNLSVSDKNDRQILEDCVDWNGKELKRLGSGVNHTDKEESDREPCVADDE
jgi:hypothetical protein